MLVLGPTKELVEQLTRVAKSLSHTAKFSSTMLTSSNSKSDQNRTLSGPIDVVFATPGRLLQHNEEGAVHLGDVKWVVVDEADTMILKVGSRLVQLGWLGGRLGG
jgi:superfamily II DNA/RNA helicase